MIGPPLTSRSPDCTPVLWTPCEAPVKIRNQIWEFIRGLCRDEQVTVFFTTQYLYFANAFSPIKVSGSEEFAD
jgi:hypothetical protein